MLRMQAALFKSLLLIKKHFDTDSWSETVRRDNLQPHGMSTNSICNQGNNLYGCLKQMYLLKMKQRFAF
jgi:hypothetical protein